MIDTVTRNIKFFIDTLLLSVVYLLIKSYINGYFIGIVILINYASTIFIEALVIAIIMRAIIYFIQKIRKK